MQWGLSEDPTTCPKCGVRTEFDELPDGSQAHKCLGCGFEFIGVWDETLRSPVETTLVDVREVGEWSAATVTVVNNDVTGNVELWVDVPSSDRAIVNIRLSRDDAVDLAEQIRGVTD